MERINFLLLFISLLIITASISAQTAVPDSSPVTDPSAAADPVTAEEILSEHSIYGIQEVSGNAENRVIIDGVCNFDQRNAMYLYNDFREAPDSLSAGERQIVNDIITLLEQYEITDDDQKDYLLTVASASGCGYALPVEILLDRYLTDPEAFEKKFGYPLYYVNEGEVEYNLDTIFMDIFLKKNSEKYKRSLLRRIPLPVC